MHCIRSRYFFISLNSVGYYLKTFCLIFERTCTASYLLPITIRTRLTKTYIFTQIWIMRHRCYLTFAISMTSSNTILLLTCLLCSVNRSIIRHFVLYECTDLLLYSSFLHLFLDNKTTSKGNLTYSRWMFWSSAEETIIVMTGTMEEFLRHFFFRSSLLDLFYVRYST